MRTEKSFLNMVVGVGGQMLTVALSFVNRIIFTRYLAVGYLGVNGLFSNIIGLLSMAELGFGSAMVYSLYKPAAEDDREAVARLMNLYKRMYQWIALVVLALGLALYPFLDYFIKDAGGVEHLHLIYLMYLANSVASYLLAYKSSLLLVNQRTYVQLLYNYSISILQLFAQIAVLVLTQDYLLYLAVQIAGSVVQNLFIARRVDRDYPYITRTKELPPKELRRDIWKNVYALSAHKIGGTLVSSTDNLIMSAYVGLSSVGIYSNYTLVINQIGNFLSKIYTAFTGSVGNLNALEGGERIYKIFQTMDFFVFLLSGYVSAELFVMLNPFIELFFGREYLFSMPVVLVIIVKVYLSWIQEAPGTFKSTMGLFWQDRYKPLAEALINLVVSIALVFRYEIVGIFIGTIVSSLTTGFWVTPYVLMRYGMKTDWQHKLKVYFLQFAQKTAGMAVGMFAAYEVCALLPHSNFALLVLKAVVCTLVYCAVIWLLFRRSPQYLDLKERVTAFLRREWAAHKAKRRGA